MLAGDAAAASDTLFQDLSAGGQDALDLGRVAFVEQQNRMNVPVARMEDIHDLNVVFLADFHDAAEDVRQLRARDHAVLRAITWAQPADRPECLLAAFPQLLPLGRRHRLPNLAGIALVAQLDDPISLCVQAYF